MERNKLKDLYIAINEYLLDITNILNCSITTIGTYRKELNTFKEYVRTNDIEWETLSFKEFKEYYYFIQNRRYEHNNKDIFCIYATLNEFYNYHVEKGRIDKNQTYQKVFESQSREKLFEEDFFKSNKIPFYIEEDKFLHFLDLCENNRDKLLFYLLYATNAEVKDILIMQRNDIEENKISIKYNNKRKTIYLDERANLYYKNYLLNEYEELPESKNLFVKNGNKSKKTIRLDSNGIQRILKYYRKKHEIPVLVKTLKNSYIVNMIKRKKKIFSIQQILGLKETKLLVSKFFYYLSEENF